MISKFLILRWTCNNNQLWHQWNYWKSCIFRCFLISLNSWYPNYYYDLGRATKINCVTNGIIENHAFSSGVLISLNSWYRKKFLILRWTCDKNQLGHQWNYWKPVIFLRFFDQFQFMSTKFLILRWTCDKNQLWHQWNYWKPFIVLWFFDQFEFMSTIPVGALELCQQFRWALWTLSTIPVGALEFCQQ